MGLVYSGGVGWILNGSVDSSGVGWIIVESVGF